MIKMNAAKEARAYLLLRIEKTSVRTVWVSNIQAVPGIQIHCLRGGPNNPRSKTAAFNATRCTSAPFEKSSATRKTLQNFSGDALKCTPCYSSKPMQNGCARRPSYSPHAFLPTPDLLQLTFQRLLPV